MLFLAATALEKLRDVPSSFWLKLALGVVAFFLLAFVLRKVAGMNKIILAILIFMVISLIGFQWIYERNEPAFLTPFVNTVAQFFPTKNSYGTQQQQDPGAPKQKKAPAR